ncbi:hypothetical protein RMS29_002170 [Agrobacterium rosae]|uniref:Uncharacterized protein n=1 Tax=Agrobacterium rosae TaxID=1972867 RepID=A0AAE5RU12_9HYPH|nr:hypothetical protein [Agrobacterium rosae]KAA3514052.1 hypothetical protein DXM21_04215 [Agrobacterium rosae]KAA3522719.1 hypothetical protein DXM25_04215 [Agrobacterium rosae]MCM2434020.1 hypothetical protein [Agrobacterium rosae]MDX8330421.1 hypothetical protein [Agrobacterium rosae]MQB47382.1 hypothetical protein [Agrobacterium rosae]
MGDDGDAQVALELPDLDAATQFAQTYTSVEPAPAILIRNDLISDTHSFWLQTISRRGDGTHFITNEKMLVSCNSIQK